jgi:hypothetical protein
MRRNLSVFLAILFISIATKSFPAEPMTEFRGIKWGTHISELKEMKFVTKESGRLLWYNKSGIIDEPIGS